MPLDPKLKTFSIRPAVEADVPVILDLIKQLAEYEKLSHEMIATEDAMRAALFGPRPAAEVLLAFLKQQPVAYAVYFQTYSTFLARPGFYLEDIFVKPEHRKKGIGKHMLAQLAKIAVQRGCGRFEWSVLDWNKPAIEFYTSIGARPMDAWTVYRLTSDALESLATQAQS
jgi:GNAT superfamily N-acetyltransferase